MTCSCWVGGANDCESIAFIGRSRNEHDLSINTGKKRLLFCPIASCFNEKKRCHDETSSPISLQRAAPLHHYPTRVVYFEFFLSNSTIPCTILCFLCSYISAHEIDHSKLLRLNQVWKTKDVQKRYISGAEGLNTAIVRYNNEEEKKKPQPNCSEWKPTRAWQALSFTASAHEPVENDEGFLFFLFCGNAFFFSFFFSVGLVWKFLLSCVSLQWHRFEGFSELVTSETTQSMSFFF